MSKMKAISSAILISPLLLASCGLWGDSESRIDDKPVLSPLVQGETRSRIDFSRHVAPILEERCVWCHNGKDKKMDYALTDRDEAFKNKRIVPGKPEKSLLYLAASGEHPALEDSSVSIRVAPSDLKVLERWIDSGAIWPQGDAGELKGR